MSLRSGSSPPTSSSRTAGSPASGAGPWRARAEAPAAGQGRLAGPDRHAPAPGGDALTPASWRGWWCRWGRASVISDSHEIGNVLGLHENRHADCRQRQNSLNLFFMASSCVPATRMGRRRRRLGPQQIRELLGRRRVLGLAGVMNIQAVLGGARRLSGEDRGRPRHVAASWTGARAGLKGRELHRLRGGRHPLRPRIDDRRGSPRQGCTGNARAGPRRLECPEPRRPASAAGQRRHRRRLVPATTSSTTTCSARGTSTACSGGSLRAVWPPPSPSATPRAGAGPAFRAPRSAPVAPGYRADLAHRRRRARFPGPDRGSRTAR